MALEINGFSVADGKPLSSFAKLTADGSTACGMWIYTGYWADLDPAKAACKRRKRETTGIGTNLEWSFAWPLNRRIIYNRCSADLKGNPWNPNVPVAAWDGSKWVMNDVPDFNATLPPEKSGAAPFIMLPEGVGRLFAAGLKDGPIPEHYEPMESPVKNIMSSQQNNPLVRPRKPAFGRLSAAVNPAFPYVLTTHRLIEHYQSGAVTRNCPWLVELMPEAFVTISPKLASKLGINPGDKVVVSTERGEITCKANVMAIVKPLKINGKEVEIVAMPWHWGYQGLGSGVSANDITPYVGDPNTQIPEYKAFTCNIRKA